MEFHQQDALWWPIWLPDETLYAWCARYHRRAGGMRAESTSTALFGHPRLGLRHDFPGAVAHFVRQTNAALGSADELLLGRTVLGYYMRFRPVVERRWVIDLLAQGPVVGLKAKVGWLASRVGAAHPLKACPACLTEDLHRRGWANWRLAHQLPGVWFCPTHLCLLRATDLKVGGERRFGYVMPDEVPRAQWRPSPIRRLADPAGLLWCRIADMSARMISDNLSAPLEHRRVALALSAAAHSAGYTGRGERVQLSGLGRSFLSHCERLKGVPEANALPHTIGGAEEMWRNLLDTKHRPLHPLRYLLAIDWLFADWAAWCTAYDDAETARAERLRPQSEGKADRRHLDRTEFLAAMEAGYSASRAAKAAGVNTQTGLQWSAAAGKQVHHRPKRLTQDLRAAIENDLRLGRSKPWISAKHGLSSTTITRILLADNALRLKRATVIAARQEERAKRAISQCIGQYPAIGRKELQSKHPAAHAWLYRHDRSWLQSATQGLRPKQLGDAQRVNWNARDNELSRAVLGCKLRLASSGGAPSRAAVARAVPQLRLNVRHLARLPMTRTALETVLSAAIPSSDQTA